MQLQSTLAETQEVGTQFFYKRVTQDIGSTPQNVVRSVYRYRNYDGDLTYAGVKMTEKIDYKNIGGLFTPKAKSAYQYSTTPVEVVTGAKFPYLETMGAPIELAAYKSDLYYLTSGWLEQQQTIATTYDGDSIKNITQQVYSKLTHNLIRSYQTTADGEQLLQKMKYPEDYATANEIRLAKANLVMPIETQVWRMRTVSDSVLVSATLNQYDTVSFKPIRIYTLSEVNGIISLNNQTINSAGKYTTLLSDSRYESRVDFMYDGYAKLIRQQRTKDIPIGYKWGYNQTYPIAECRNATESEFFIENFEENGAATSTGIPHTGRKYYSGSSYVINFTRPNARAYVITYWYLSAGKWLRKNEQPYTSNSFVLTGGTGYDDVGIYPADAQLLMYTYQTGQGTTSSIDARGLTSYYEYDNFNRLLNVKDENAKIVENYRYNHTNTSPIWINTGSAYCITDVNGNNTGEQRIMQRDSNPASASYNSTRSFLLGPSTFCPPPAFAKLILMSSNSTTTSGYTLTTWSYNVRLFSDVACTIPYFASSAITVNYKISYVTTFGNGDPPVYSDVYGTRTIPTGSDLSPSLEISSGCSPPVLASKSAAKKTQSAGEDPEPTSVCTEFSVVILSGTGYIPKN